MSEAPPPVPAAPSRNPIRRLYAWILTWAHHPWGTWVLAILSFLDSSVFPIPPLFLQVALSLERPRRSFWYATVNCVASVLGAVLGYVIGYYLYNSIGHWVIETWSTPADFEKFRLGFAGNMFIFVLIYSFVPFPFKVITIGSGLLHASLPTLLIASTIGRGFRFYLLAAVCLGGGAKSKVFIDKYFNWVLAGVGLLVLAVVLVMKLWLRG